MKIFIDRDGSMVVDRPTPSTEFVVLEVEPGTPINIKKLDELVYLVRLGNESDPKLIIFRTKMNRTARVLPICNVVNVQSPRLLSMSVFHRLLNFECNGVSQRNRNLAITIVRNTLPDVVRGYVIGDPDMLYYLKGNLLSIFKDRKRLARLPYTSFSRNIKESLLCSTN
jgi:hypothetical protein